MKVEQSQIFEINDKAIRIMPPLEMEFMSNVMLATQPAFTVRSVQN